jgi:biopolymer transport protein ExbD
MPFRSKPRDPHAHALRAPGRRLLRAIPLHFVSKRAAGGDRRPVHAPLSLVSFIDFLIVTVLFLLGTFSASASCPDRNVDVPGAHNVDAIVDAPMVAVTSNQILVDGALAGYTSAIEESARMQKIEELFARLQAKRQLWKALEPNRPFPGVCLLQIDKDVPAVVVKSVFQTAALAGYPNVSFVVQELR